MPSNLTWQKALVFVGLGTALGLTFARGGLAVLAPILKIAAPFVLAYLAFRFLKNRFFPAPVLSEKERIRLRRNVREVEKDL